MAGGIHTDQALTGVTGSERRVVEAGPPGRSVLPPGPTAGAEGTRAEAPTGSGMGGMARTCGGAVLAALPAWIVARVLVVFSLALAHWTYPHVVARSDRADLRLHQGLLAWDGGWYESIAGHGYAASGLQSVRFFPAYPMAARVLGWIPGLGVGTALLLISNLCALAAMAALLVLVRRDRGDPALARRSVWLLALAPSAYSLVLGYADTSLLLCSVVTVLAARTRRWWWAAAAGLVAGAVRPVGVLLVVPVLVEVLQSRRTTPTNGGWAARGAALVAPLAGAGAYLAWVDAQFGDPWLPFRVQQQGGHRGPITSPLAAMWHNAVSVVHGHHVGSALHVPWVVLCAVLLVVAFRRLPLSYAAFAAAVLAVSLTTSNLDSFERYALGAFPLVVAASTLTARRWVESAVLAAAGATMVGYAFLAFSGVVVP